METGGCDQDQIVIAGIAESTPVISRRALGQWISCLTPQEVCHQVQRGRGGAEPHDVWHIRKLRHHSLHHSLAGSCFCEGRDAPPRRSGASILRPAAPPADGPAGRSGCFFGVALY